MCKFKMLLFTFLYHGILGIYWLWCLDDELKEWAEENGIKINSSLDLYNFPGTGRGFISKRQILKHQTVLEIPKEILLNVNWIYQNGISCVSQAVKTNPNFRIDAFEMVTLWLMYEKQKGCRSDLRTEFKILAPFLRSRDVLFELETEIIFQPYHQIVNVLFHYTIALNNWNFFQNNSETKLKTSEMKCKIDLSHWKESGERAPPRGHFRGQIFSGLQQWFSRAESNATAWIWFLTLGLSLQINLNQKFYL